MCSVLVYLISFFNAVYLVRLEVNVLGCSVCLHGLPVTQHLYITARVHKKTHLLRLGFSA